MRRLEALGRIPRVYIRTAWWGLLSPRFSEREPLVIVQAVVLEHGGEVPRVLLSVRADVQGWELPGGNIETGENAEEALRREVQEETGLHVEIMRRIGDYTTTGFRPHRARVYLCRKKGGQLRASRETPQVEWCRVDRLPRTLFPWYREPLADALEEQQAPVERTRFQGISTIVQAISIDLRMRWQEGRAR